MLYSFYVRTMYYFKCSAVDQKDNSASLRRHCFLCLCSLRCVKISIRGGLECCACLKMELQQLQDSQLSESREVATFSHHSCGSTPQAEEVERGNQTCDAVCQVMILG